MAVQQTLRDEAEASTRERILQAFVECLDDLEDDEFSLALVARAANISERTLYRYFPNRDELRGAAASRIHEKFFRFSGCADLDELPSVYRAACVRFEDNPVLAKAMARYPRVGDRAAFREKVLEAHHRGLRDAVPDLPEAQVRMVLGILACLDNVAAWVTMKEELGLSGSEIADAVEWALTTLVADLRRGEGEAPRKVH
jgi:AcrR family transcriptional regulator